MYIYVYIYAYINIYTCIYRYMCVHIYTYVWVRQFVGPAKKSKRRARRRWTLAKTRSSNARYPCMSDPV